MIYQLFECYANNDRLEISVGFLSGYCFYNDKRPWWKTKRPVLFLRKNTHVTFEFKGLSCYFENLFVRFDGCNDLLKLVRLKNG